MYKYLLKRMPEDERDWTVDKLYKFIRPTVIPDKIDLSTFQKMPGIQDQLTLGACGPHAEAAALGFMDGLGGPVYSRLFEYYTTRLIMGTVDEDSGVEFRSMFKAGKQYGICDEQFCEYNVDKFTEQPSNSAFGNALSHKIDSYAFLHSIEDVMVSLANGIPVLVGIDVFPDLESDQAYKDGIITMPGDGVDPLGGHAILLVGLDKQFKFEKDGLTGGFKWRNSWGIGWGLQGYGYMPFEYFNKGYVFDPAVIKKVTIM